MYSRVTSDWNLNDRKIGQREAINSVKTSKQNAETPLKKIRDLEQGKGGIW